MATKENRNTQISLTPIKMIPSQRHFNRDNAKVCNILM